MWTGEVVYDIFKEYKGSEVRKNSYINYFSIWPLYQYNINIMPIRSREYGMTGATLPSIPTKEVRIGKANADEPSDIESHQLVKDDSKDKKDAKKDEKRELNVGAERR